MQRPLVFLGRRRSGTTVSDALQTAVRTAPLPRVVWIELTSRCPYDCPFCSRKTLRGHGVNMPLDLYRRIVGELGHPEILRLNYSGESVHHPQIVDAVAIAAATGAWVELVSVPAALAPDRLAAIIGAGLNRLTVSLHTLEAAQFVALYGFGSLDAMLANLRQAAAAATRAPRPFVVDLAFVATARNLRELPRVAALAAELALPVLAVHPVIRRTAIPERFAGELDDAGTLRHAFRADLAAAVDAARRAHPSLAVEVSTPELEDADERSIGGEPAPWPGPLPEGARIHSCDQDPFETLHILADGKVVTCEVRDRVVAGDLTTDSLAQVWHGPAMRAFREAFTAGRDAHCRACAYKRVHRPAAIASRVAAGENTAQLLHGWHAPDTGVVWSKPEAALLLARDRRARMLVISGVLPPGRGGIGNALAVEVDGEPALTITNADGGMLAFTRTAPLPECARDDGAAVVRTHAASAWRPILGGGADARTLGFALTSAEIR